MLPVGGHPLNVAITPDGTRAYVADAGAPGVVSQSYDELLIKRCVV
jgi:DNA-binding beta-propeller fold protein YncE